MTRDPQPIPNFFIVGAPKSGTTALSSYLREHVDVFFSQPKELNYFNTDFTDTPKSEAWYLKHFTEANNAAAIGEGTTWYLSSTEAIENIATFNPEAKIIVMLRDPVELFHSLYHQNRFVNKESASTPRDAWELQEKRASMPGKTNRKALQYREICRFGKQLERVYRHVPADQVLVIFFEDFKDDTAEVYRKTLAFLGLNDDGREHFPAINRRRSTGFPKLDRLIEKLHIKKKRLGITKGIGHTRLVEQWVFGNKRDALSSELKAMIRTDLRADIMKLEELTGRDLSHWRGEN